MLCVSRSGYYAWQRRPESSRKRGNRALLVKVREIHSDRHKRCYGSPRMTKELNRQGYKCSRHRSAEGWLYLAVVLDLFSRMVVGWSMKPRMTAELVCEALRMAIANRLPIGKPLMHSDRGCRDQSEWPRNDRPTVPSCTQVCAKKEKFAGHRIVRTDKSDLSWN
jgi:transposase InsO family protein